MNKLQEISQSPEQFARFTKRVAPVTIVGFVAVVGLLLVQVLSR